MSEDDNEIIVYYMFYQYGISDSQKPDEPLGSFTKDRWHNYYRILCSGVYERKY